MLWGYSLETIYFYVLIVTALLAVISFFVGDIINFDGPIDPVLIVPTRPSKSFSEEERVASDFLNGTIK